MRTILVFLVLVTANLFANQYGARFYIEPENQKFLKYFVFENDFDSAYVQCKFGEFAIYSQSGDQLIFISDSIENIEGRKAQGDSALSGEQTNLLSIARTVDFVVPQNSTMKFYRELNAVRPCDYGAPTGSPTGGGSGTEAAYDAFWKVGQGVIPEQTEFVLQLKKSSSDEVIAVLDSVGVDANPYSVYAQRYGTNVSRMNHSVQIPQSAEGLTCYLQISPRRWGPTPFGINMWRNYNWINYSVSCEYDTTDYDIFFLDSTDMDTLELIYFDRLIVYRDSVLQSDGYVPVGIVFLSHDKPELMDSLRRRFTVPKIADNGDTVRFMIENPQAQGKKPSTVEDWDLPYRTNFRSLKFDFIYPNPVSGNMLYINLMVYNERMQDRATFSIKIYDLEGREISTAWNGSLQLENTITVDIKDLPRGAYFMALIQDEKYMLDIKQFIRE